MQYFHSILVFMLRINDILETSRTTDQGALLLLLVPMIHIQTWEEVLSK